MRRAAGWLGLGCSDPQARGPTVCSKETASSAARWRATSGPGHVGLHRSMPLLSSAFRQARADPHRTEHRLRTLTHVRGSAVCQAKKQSRQGSASFAVGIKCMCQFGRPGPRSLIMCEQALSYGLDSFAAGQVHSRQVRAAQSRWQGEVEAAGDKASGARAGLGVRAPPAAGSATQAVGGRAGPRAAHSHTRSIVASITARGAVRCGSSRRTSGGTPWRPCKGRRRAGARSPSASRCTT
jgi:hypothetical protein